MKLSDIDLNNPEEVAAAHALLAAVLGKAVTVPTSHAFTGAPEQMQALGITAHTGQVTVINRVGDMSQTFTGAADQLAERGLIPHADRPDVGQASIPITGAGVNSYPPGADPAAIFGGAAAPLPPAAAPSIAGVAQLPTAPVGMPAPVGVSAPTAPPMPAPYIAPEVHAQSHASIAGLTPPAPSVELDRNGLPWDDRIHAGTKRKNADGSWTAKRGLNDGALVARVEAELRARVAAPFAPSAAPPAASNPAPVMPVAPTASPSDGPATFEQLMMRATAAITAGQAPLTALQDAAVAAGLQSIVQLQAAPQHVSAVWAHLRHAHPGVQ